MRYSSEEIEKMNEKELEELIEREDKTQLSSTAQTIIRKNRAGIDELELLKKKLGKQ